MTLDDLEEVFFSACKSAWLSSDPHKTSEINRAGIAAVIRALRDEMVNYFKTSYRLEDDHLIALFAAEAVGVIEGILAESQDGKAADGPTSNAGDPTCGFTASAATTPHADDGLLILDEVGSFTKEQWNNIKPKEKVCVWTTGGEHGGLQPSCTDAWTFSPYVERRPPICPSCGLPIQLQEGK